MPTRTLRSALPAAILLLATLGVAPALGQTAGPQLSDQQLKRPSIGLTTTLPLGARMSSYQISGAGVSSVELPGMAAIVNVSDRRLAEPKTPREIMDAIVRDNLAAVSAIKANPNTPEENQQLLDTAKGKLLSRETRQIGGWPVEVAHLRLAGLSGDDMARSYAIFMPTSTSVAIYEMQTTMRELEAAKPYFNLLIESTTIADPVAAEAERALGVEAGLAFIRSLEPRDYEAVINDLGKEWRYERFYRPAKSGADSDASELGYRRTRYSTGTRGDLRSKDERTGSSPEDRQKGYLVQQEIRLLLDDRIVDVSAGFFMTPDRTNEAWTIRQTIRPMVGGSRAAATHLVESAVRDRASMVITRSQGGKPLASVQPRIEGNGYVSRVEVYLMPYLMMHKDTVDALRFYAFNQNADTITLRSDELRPRPSGGFEYVSRPGEDAPGQTVLFDRSGDPVRADLPGEQVWEPVTLRRLYDLWRDKGLPLE